MAAQRLRSFPTPSADVDDLVQSGFLALLEAVRTYDSTEECFFITWLNYHLKTAFSDALGMKTDRQRHDPVHFALSLDGPLSADDPEGAVLADTVPDKDAYADAERCMWLEQLRQALDSALQSLPAEQREIIEARYFSDSTLEELADDYHVTGNAIRQRETKALRTLRTGKHMRHLEPFRQTMYDVERAVDEQTNYYQGMGPAHFQEAWSSGVEHLTIYRDGIRRSMLRQHGIYEPHINALE